MKYLPVLFLCVFLVACNVGESSSKYNFEFKSDMESEPDSSYTIAVKVSNNNGKLVDGKVYAEIDTLDKEHGLTLPLISKEDGIYEQEYSFSVMGEWQIIFHYIHDYETYKSDPFIINIH